MQAAYARICRFKLHRLGAQAETQRYVSLEAGD